MKTFSKNFLLFIAFFSAVALPQMSLANAEPELPRVYIDTTYTAPTGRSINVRAGENLQKAIDEASLGDEIVLESGVEFRGSFILRKKPGSGYIVIRSADKSRMARIVSPGRNLPAIKTEKAASGYRLMDIEVAKLPNESLVNLIVLGDGSEKSESELPKNIILDNLYVHGDANSNLRRCIALNGASMAVINSRVTECHEIGADSQAIAGWNGIGPFKIVNNRLEAAGENIIFGGSDPALQGAVSEDIEIRDNYFFKPLSWKIGHPTYAGKPWTVKNIFELKNARRVLIDNNVFENSWKHAQAGTAIMFKSANQDGKCPWCSTSDVTFTNNTVRNADEGLLINASEGTPPLPPAASRIKIENIVFENISSRFIQIYNGANDITISRVVSLSPANNILMGDGGSGKANPGLVIKDSVFTRGKYGIGPGAEEGAPYINKWFPGAKLENVTIINSSDTSIASLVKRYPAQIKIVSDKSQASLNATGAKEKSSPPPSSSVPEIPQNSAPSAPASSPRNSSGSGGGGGSSGGRANSNSIEALQAKIAELMKQLAAMGVNTSPAATPQYSSASFQTNMGIGNSGPSVITLQQMLVSKGFLAMPAGASYGYFGPLTKAAVASWQGANGIPATGYFGPMSRAKASQ